MTRARTEEEIDTELSQAARRGDARAWRALVRRHTPRVYRLAARMLGPGAEAEDACQEAFMRAHASFESYDPERALAPWLGRITYHACLKRLAKAKQLGPTMESFEGAELVDGATPEGEVSARETNALVLAALDQLSAQDRALVTLRYMDGLTDLEVGETVGMNRNTVRTRLHRARLVLQGALAPLLGGRG